MTDTGQYDVVPDEEHHRFDRGPETAGPFPLPLAPLDLSSGDPDGQEDEHGGKRHEHDVLGRRDIDVRAGDVPGARQMPFAERQLDHMAIRRVLEDHLADVGRLHHRRNLVSKNKSGNSTPT